MLVCNQSLASLDSNFPQVSKSLINFLMDFESCVSVGLDCMCELKYIWQIFKIFVVSCCDVLTIPDNVIDVKHRLIHSFVTKINI